MTSGPTTDPAIAEVKAALTRARRLRRRTEHQDFPLEGLLGERDWQAVWALLDELEDARPDLMSVFGDEDEAASAVIEHLDVYRRVLRCDRLADRIVKEHASAPSWLVTVALANASLDAGFVALGDRLALVATYDSDVDRPGVRAARHADGPDAMLEKHFRDRTLRGARRDRDDETGLSVDTRAMSALVSVEHGPRGRAILRAEVRARYALAVWCLLAPPPNDPSATTMWPAVARWVPQPTTFQVAPTKKWQPGSARDQRDRARGPSYEYPPWRLPEAETLQTALEAIRLADAGRHYAGALLTAARALHLAAAPLTELSAVERLAHIAIAQEALGQRPPSVGRKPEHSFDALCDRLAIWSALEADYGIRGVSRARARLVHWRTLALHLPHSFRAQWGLPAGHVLFGRAGQPGEEFSPALARRDLAVTLAATATATAALWWLAHDSHFDDAQIEPLLVN